MTMTADPRTLVPRPGRDPGSRLRYVVSAAMWANEFPPGLRRVRMGATGTRRTGQAPEIRKPGPAYGDGRDRGRSVSVRTLPGASTGTLRAGRTLDHQALGSHEARQRR